MKKLDCILFVDDNPDDNFFHKRIIDKAKVAHKVLALESGQDALDYLRQGVTDNSTYLRPDLIFLDINMPAMNGWEFLKAYNKLDDSLKAGVVLLMLTTSFNPDDQKKARRMNTVTGFYTKPLTAEMIEEIIQKHFPKNL